MSSSDAGDIRDPAARAVGVGTPGDLGAPGALGVLDLATVLRWADGAVAVLDRARPVLDRANVFPVPDADTGTNLAATLAAARDAALVSAATGDASADRVLHAFARGALVGARGSSGVILSEFLRGLAGAGPGSPATSTSAGTGTGKATGTGGSQLARALDRGARRAVAAVVDPRPGTMLTAARGAADAALETSAAGGDLVQTVESARSGATDALRRSVDELDVLRQAGVLDAGAYGFVLLLDALGAALLPDPEGATAALGPVSVGHGTILLMDSLTVSAPRAPGGREARSGSADDGSQHGSGDQVAAGPVASVDHARHAHHGAVDGEFELMCVVRHTVPWAADHADHAADGADTPAPAPGPADADGTGDAADAAVEALAAVAPALRAGLQQVGDSVVVVGGPDRSPEADASRDRHGLWQVHVHTDHPLDALRVLDRWEVGPVVVRCLSHQVSAVTSRQAVTSTPVGVVACTGSPGLVMDLARSGAVVVLRGDGAVEREDLLRAAHETDAEHVVVLPADEPTLALARGLTGLARPSVTVIGSTSDLHVVAALSAWVVGDPVQAGDLRTALAPVVSAVDAVRAVRLDASRPAELRDEVVRLLGVTERRSPDEGGAPPLDVVDPAGDRALPTGATASTVLTVLVGDLVPAPVVSDLVARAGRLVPGVEVVVLPSGRRSTALVIGAEQQ